MQAWVWVVDVVGFGESLYPVSFMLMVVYAIAIDTHRMVMPEFWQSVAYFA